MFIWHNVGAHIRFPLCLCWWSIHAYTNPGEKLSVWNNVSFGWCRFVVWNGKQIQRNGINRHVPRIFADNSNRHSADNFSLCYCLLFRAADNLWSGCIAADNSGDPRRITNRQTTATPHTTSAKSLRFHRARTRPAQPTWLPGCGTLSHRLAAGSARLFPHRILSGRTVLDTCAQQTILRTNPGHPP